MLYEMSAGSRVAIYFTDNETSTFKLMAAKGYCETSLEQMKIVPFNTESLLKYIWQQKAPIAVQDITQAPDFTAQIMSREGALGEIVVPLMASGNLIGAVQLEVSNAQLLDFVDFLREIVDVCAVSVANAVAFGRSEYERERLNTLYKSTCSLNSSSLEVGQILQIAADTALVLANTPSCALLLIDSETEDFQLAAFKGLDGESLRDFSMSGKKSLAAEVLRSGKLELADDASSRPLSGMPRAMGGKEFTSCAAVPLIDKERKIGVLEVFSIEARAFHKESLEFLEMLGRQVSASLSNALSHELVSSQTILDAHTGLCNRVYYHQALVKELERSNRHHHEVSILLLDIDHLCQINDMLGQLRGDEAIKHVAAVIKANLRDIDTSARFGGEEFAVILPETGKASALEAAERLKQLIKKSPAPGIGLITVSIGVASGPVAGLDNADGLIDEAQKALNIAKYKGRDRVVVAQTDKYMEPGSISWDKLANEAKLAVISERQARMQSRLTAAPEYATWMAKPVSLTGKKKNTPVDF
jgi:diguanylate cyclase (GGDEF)-like protein